MWFFEGGLQILKVKWNVRFTIAVVFDFLIAMRYLQKWPSMSQYWLLILLSTYLLVCLLSNTSLFHHNYFFKLIPKITAPCQLNFKLGLTKLRKRKPSLIAWFTAIQSTSYYTFPAILFIIYVINTERYKVILD